MATTVDWDATLALVRWRQARRELSADAQLVDTGLALLAPPLAQLDAAARALNVSWPRLASEAAQLAVFLLTRARRDDGQTAAPAALRLLRLALDAFAARDESDALALPTNASNLLLAAVADVLEKEEERDALLDVKRVLLFLFGMAEDSSGAADTAPPSFQLYKPPTNVFSDFMHRALTAVVTRLSSDERTVGDDVEREYVAIARAVVVVYQELQRSQVNKRKVFLAVAKTSLRDLIGYRHALVQLQTRGVEGIASVVELLDRIVVDALFDAEHIRDFDGALVHTSIWRHANQLTTISAAANEEAAEPEDSEGKSKKKRRKNDGVSALVSYQKNLFDELKAFLSDAAVAVDLKSSAGGLMQVLVGAFAVRIRAAAHSKIEDTKTDLKTSKKRAATVIATASTTYSPFKFWSELCAVSFLAFKQLESSGDAADALALLVKLYKSLFQALCDADVYRVTEDTDEREQFEAMETILVAFLNLVNRSVAEVSTPASLLHIQEQCHVVSCAVRCSPNLVNSSLVPIFEILGGHIVASKTQTTSHFDAVLVAGSACVSDLVHSYESMRLLDKFLEASMSTEPSKRVSEGLYALFSHSQCESALRRAFMTLPPGQLEVLWSLFTNQLAAKYEASSKDEDDIFSVGLVRFVFQVFLQEVHVTPQNKAKVAALTAKTHEKLFAPVVPRLLSSSKALVLSPEEREVFGLFGELLSFYDILADVRSETFDAVLAALKKRSVTSAMNALLAAKTSGSRNKSSKKHVRTQERSLDSTGVIKICIFWLRKASSVRYAPSEIVTVSESDLLTIALLVVDHVIECKCWDALAFYLPELLDVVPVTKAQVLLNELVTAYLAEVIRGAVDGPATRIVREAAFYEIRTFQAVAPAVFATLTAEYGVDSPSALEHATHLFDFLDSLPNAYLERSSCSDLLVNALALHEAAATSASADSEQSKKMLDALLGWLQSHFKRIAIAVASKSSDVRKQVDAGARFIFLQAASSGASGRISAALLGDMLSFYLDDAVGASEFVGELFTSVALKKATPSVNLVRSTLVVEALADLRLSGDKSFGARKVTAEENKFIGTLVSQLKQADALDDSTSFAVLGALVKYRAAIADSQNQHKQSKASDGDQVQQLHSVLSSQLRAALARSMAVVVSDERPVEAWRFFTSFCAHFAAFRPSVTIETFGCLLAVALTLVSKSSLTEVENAQAVRALRAIVANSSKDEYRLLLSTVSKEASAPEWSRAVSALKALSLLLQGERKLSAARRESLNQHKDEIVGALIHNFSRSLAASRSDTSSQFSRAEQAELCTWNLQVFVLIFTKAELFTWKTHELAHIFIGFQPLLAVASHWQSRQFSAQQVHQIWMLSYTLLLRIVRHHFASLVNGTPHIIQATNALLELLVVASNKSTGNEVGQTSQFAEWSSNLARLYGYMKEHDSQLRKHVVYLMLAYLVSVTRDNLSVELQQKLRPGVFSLLDICSLFEKEQLYAALDSTGKSLLKSLDTSYKLTHRYAGKV